MAKCRVVFSQSLFEVLTAFRVRYVLLLVSILTSNAPGQWQMTSNAENFSIWWRHHVFKAMFLTTDAETNDGTDFLCMITDYITQCIWVWWHHDIDTFAYYLLHIGGPLGGRNPPVTGGFSHKGLVMRMFDVSNRLWKKQTKTKKTKQSKKSLATGDWRCLTLVWRHCNECPGTNLEYIWRALCH